MKIHKNLLEKIIWEETRLLVEEVSRTFPDLFTHMVLAIYQRYQEERSGEEGIIQAIKIALASLKKDGYITPDSNLQNISLTPDGQKKNARHAREPMQKGDSTYSLIDYFNIDDDSLGF